MKILFSGYHNPNFMSFTEYVERAIVKLGHTLEIFDFRDWLIPGRIRNRFPFLNSWDMRRINKDLIQRVKRFKPDLLLVSGGWTIFPETISLIRDLSKIITVNWIADFPLKFNDYLKVGPYYHYFFASGTDALEEYRKAGHRNGYWLPFACDPEIHKPLNLTEKEREKYSCDICFVGSLYSERVEVLEKLSEFNLGIWGIGWERLPADSPLRKFVRGGIVEPKEWVKIFNASKIVLNIIGGQCDVPYPIVDQIHMTNTKVFEILGCGAFQLVEKKKDVLRLFVPGEHLVCYENIDDLKRLIPYYLKNSNERERIAQEGYREVIQKHTYLHRIKKMLTVIGKKIFESA